MTTLIEALNGIAERVRHLEGTEDYDIGDGAPSHFAAEGRQYWDYTNDALYANNDGLNGWTFIGGTIPPGVPHAILSATHTDATPAAVVRGDVITGQDTAGVTTWQRLGLGIGNAVLMSDGLDAYWGMLAPWNLPHDLLSATHTDTVINAVTRGSLVYGNATPAWDELVIGTAHQLLKVNAGGTDPAWASFDWDEISVAAAADMAHDHSTPAEGDEIPLASLGSYTQGDLIVGGVADWTDLAIGGAGTYLRSDAADPSWQALQLGDIPAHNLLSATHGDTVVSAMAQGALVVGTAAGWDDLAHPIAAGYAFTTDATDVLWTLTPTWMDGHQWSSTRNALTALETPTNYHAILLNPADDTGEGVGLGFYISTGSNDVGAAIIHRRTGANSMGTLQFYTKQDALNASPPLLVLTLGDDGVATFEDDVHFVTGKGLTHADSVAANKVFISNGTRYVPGDVTMSIITDLAYGTPALTLGVANAAGAANTVIRTNATILAFDAVNPVTLAVATAAAPGVATVTARRDHAHAITSSSIPGATASILATTAAGLLTLKNLTINQTAAAGDACLVLRQTADTDKEFIRWWGEAAAADLTRNIVDEGDQASETRQGWLRIYVIDEGSQVGDGSYFVPFYSLSA